MLKVGTVDGVNECGDAIVIGQCGGNIHGVSPYDNTDSGYVMVL